MQADHIQNLPVLFTVLSSCLHLCLKQLYGGTKGRESNLPEKIEQSQSWGFVYANSISNRAETLRSEKQKEYILRITGYWFEAWCEN